jgi:hypothetical protein
LSAALQPFHELEKKHWRVRVAEVSESARAVELRASAAVTKNVNLDFDCMIRYSVVILIVDIAAFRLPIRT